MRFMWTSTDYEYFYFSSIFHVYIEWEVKKKLIETK